ncbi:MAG: NCS2 family nucleobase:cation symporter [Halanaerobiales bacterium]|nr:NCS2 family nucleobase:cation symporter [Halanaerobiales bacterium]
MASQNDKINNDKAVRDVDKLPMAQGIFLGLQHALAMFGATILVPILTGLHVSVALFTAGVGTWLFHFITKKKVPAYLGSSFAFIAPITLVIEQHGGIPAAQGGIIAAGIIYAIVAFIIYKVGPSLIKKIFPPIVTGPVIISIGLILAPVAIDMSTGSTTNVVVAIASLLGAVVAAIYAKGFLKIVPIIVGLETGYIVAIIAGLVDFSPVINNAWIGLPEFTVPQFSMRAITIIAPVAVVSMVEHVGDILAISETIGKGRELVTDPGIHRTMLGDGLATALAGVFGGPPNTTYGENTGVLAITKVYDSKVMRIAATFAIAMAVIPKFGGLIETIPTAVIGRVSFLLYGMIATVGIRTLVESQTDLKISRNLVVGATILVLALGGAVLKIGNIEFSSLALGALSGVILNIVLPGGEEEFASA